MLKQLRTKKVTAIVLASVMTLAGVIAAIGSTWASAPAIEFAAQQPTGYMDSNKLNLAQKTNQVVNATGASAWGSSDAGVASMTGTGRGESVTYNLRSPGKFTAFRSTTDGMVGSEAFLVYDSRLPASYAIDTDYTALKGAGATANIPITVTSQGGANLTNAVTWKSETPSIVTVNAAGQLTAVANVGFARITGTFTDCYGEAQTIVYSVIVGAIAEDKTVTVDGERWRPNPTTPNVWDKLDDVGNPTGDYLYDPDATGPADSQTPSKPLVQGEDGKFYYQDPANIFTPVTPAGQLDENNKKWGGTDEKIGTADDEDAKKFGTKHYVDFGQNIFAEISSNGKTHDAFVGGGFDEDPTTSPVVPILDNRGNDGKFYYGPVTIGADTFYVGDKRGTDGSGKIETNLGANPISSSDDKFYMGAGGVMTTTPPVTNGQGNAVDGRVLTADKAGDDSEWVEIATNGGYSLIVRSQITGRVAFSSGTSYQAYGTVAGPLRTAINTWYRGLSSTSALRTHSVGHDALSKSGTWGNLGAANGFSVPTGMPSIGDDTAFPLSFQEAANYCSVHWDNASSVRYRSTLQANLNWNKLTDRTSYWSWLRSPGGNASRAAGLGNGGSVDIGGAVTSTTGSVRPALWVQSSIFNQ